MKSTRAVLISSFIVCLLFLPSVTGAQTDPQMMAGMRWRLIGPFRGGRAISAAGVPSQPDTYFFGAVGGGVWKTTDSGRTWQPIFDRQPIASIGAIAVAPSNPNIIYAGSGEADMRSDSSFGDGMYKSVDGGKSWQHIGLEDTRQIGRIVVDAHNADIVLVAALGHGYGPNGERGVFRSSDGGHSWEKVLYRDENTGAIDLAVDDANPQMVFASLWNARRPPWSTYPPLEGAGSGIYKSTDGGRTWTALNGGGLPEGQLGRIGLAVAPGSGGQRVYAIVEHPQRGGLYRSDDGGTSWTLMSADPRIHDRGWYFGTVTVDPKNSQTVYIPNVSLYRSTDGGRSFTVLKGAPGGDDYHLLWINPEDPRRMIVASDQGTVVSVNGGKTWSSWYNQPTAQFYHVATDNEFPYRVYGAQQDSGTAAVASRSDFGEITWRDWYSVGAGESGYIVPDPSDANIVYGGDTYGTLFRWDRRTGQAENISPSLEFQFGKPIAERTLRFTWTSPLAFSPQDSRTLYMGSQFLLATNDRGKTWQRVSPDLTGADPAGSSTQGAVTPANARERGFGVIYTIAPSAAAPGEIWVGTDTGLIQITRDGGKSWTNVTPAGLPAWSKISILEASASDAATAYAAVDRHRLDDYQPYIYRTHDFGKTWKRISNGIAAPAFVRAVRQDPIRKGLLYAGTELGVYVSLDDGEHWQALQLNLPVAPIHDLVVHGNDLVAATHGRSFWILDDLTPVREMNGQIEGAEAHLFAPAKTYRVRRNVNQDTPLPPETPAGQNPPAGAILYYSLQKPGAEDIAIEIRDAKGELVRKYSSRLMPAARKPVRFEDVWLRSPEALLKDKGLNRFVWDLRYEPPQAITHEYPSAAVPGDTPEQPEGPPALPGKYEVRLIANGRTYSQPLDIVMDPRVTTPAADLARQFELEREIAQDLNRSFETVEQIKKEQSNLKATLQHERAASSQGAAGRLDAAMSALAGMAGPGARSDSLTGINSRLAALLPAVDLADAAPTAGQERVFHKLHSALERGLHEWSRLQQELARRASAPKR